MAEKFWYGGSPNHLGQWDYDNTSKTDTLDNGPAVSKSGGKVGIPITGHPFEAGDSVYISGSTNYSGTWIIDSVTENEIVIVATYVSETFAGTETIASTSNWKLAGTGEDAAKPTDGDIVYFNGRAYDDSTTGKKQSATVNVDAAGTGTPDLGGFYVSADYDGQIGSSSEYLELQAYGNDIVFEGSGTLFLKLSAGAGTDAGCGKFVVNTARGSAYIASAENNASHVSLYEHVLAFSGRLYIDSGTAITQITITSRQATIYGGTDIFNNLDDLPVNIYLVDGTIYWESSAGSLDIYGGGFFWGTEGMTEIQSCTIESLKLFTGATFTWQIAAVVKSTIKQFIIYGGLLTAAVTVNSGYNKEIGSGSEVSELWRGGVAELNNNNHNITIASGSTIECLGGTLVPPSGSFIDW